MAASLKVLRGAARLTPVQTLAIGTFKAPYDYAASARESMQSFREAKVEFKPVPAERTAVPAKKIATLAAAPAAQSVVVAGLTQANKLKLSEIKLPVLAAEKSVSVPIHDGPWEQHQFNCPFVLMPCVTEKEAEATLPSPAFARRETKAKSESIAEDEDENLGGKSLIWG